MTQLPPAFLATLNIDQGAGTRRQHTASEVQMSVQYLSFQRAPPRTVCLGQSIAVAPVITNDLRDVVFDPSELEEFEDGAASLYIQAAWVSVTAHQSIADRSPRLSVVKWESPIRWTGADCAWRNVTMAVPTAREISAARSHSVNKQSGPSRQAASSQQLRLALWVPRDVKRNGAKRLRMEQPSQQLYQDITGELAIDPSIVADRSRKHPRPHFLSALTPAFELVGETERRAAASKFDRVARLWKLPTSGAANSATVEGSDSFEDEMDYIEIQEDTDFELSKHVWDAAIPMMSHLCCSPDWLPRLQETGHTTVILELGTGTGLLSVYLERFFRSRSQQGTLPSSRPATKIFASDLAAALDLVEINSCLNSVGGLEGVSALELDWFTETLPSSIQEALGSSRTARQLVDAESIDSNEPGGQSDPPRLVVLASDCSYNPDSYAVFGALLHRLHSFCSARAIPIEMLVSKKHRHEDEKSLWSALRRHGLAVSLTDGVVWGELEEASSTSHAAQPPDDAAQQEQRELGDWGIFTITVQNENRAATKH
ncbi:unnamed protein product [Parajaminaea phylloscopi]